MVYNEIDYNSAIEEYDNRDYSEEIAGSSGDYEGESNAVATFSNIKYNQRLVHSKSCTGQAACGVISDVTKYALPLSFRKQVWANQLETGASETRGDKFINGIKQAVKLFNEENPELPFKLEYYRIRAIKSDELFEVLKNSSVLAGYKGRLGKDAQDNGVIDNLDNPSGGGHCIRIVKAWKENGKIRVKYCDNYEGLITYNIITVNNLTDNKDFFTGGYYIKKVNR